MGEDDLMVVSCPSCTQRFRVRQQSAGRAVKCPHCEQAVQVPLLSNAAVEPAARSQQGFQLGPPTPQSTAAAAPMTPTPATSALGPTAAAVPGPVDDPASLQQPSQPALQTPATRPEPYPPRQADPNPFQSPVPDLAPMSVSGLPAKRHYPALQIIRTIYLVMACLVVLGWVLFMAWTLVIAARAGAVGLWLGASIVPTASAATAATMLVAVAELIKLALDIQSNTLAAARNTADRSQ